MEIDAHTVGDAWARAEASGDVATLRGLLDPEFRGVGPHGFVLDRDRWLARFEQPFTVEHLTIADVEVREHGDSALLVGVQDQRASYRGNRADGRYRVSLVLRRTGGRWTVWGSHLSGPIPALPGRPDA